MDRRLFLVLSGIPRWNWRVRCEDWPLPTEGETVVGVGLELEVLCRMGTAKWFSGDAKAQDFPPRSCSFLFLRVFCAMLESKRCVQGLSSLRVFKIALNGIWSAVSAIRLSRDSLGC